MTKLGGQSPEIVRKIRSEMDGILQAEQYQTTDAQTKRTGKDYLQKIWEIIISVPIGIAVLYEGIPVKTLGNIFYEIGLMHALGKEVLIVKDRGALIPSDFIRTEYIEYTETFSTELIKMIRSWNETAQHYLRVADMVANNPLLALDYMRRAYLLSGDVSIIEQKNQLVKGTEFEVKAKNSVEGLMANF